jgi:hypothetical protein
MLKYWCRELGAKPSASKSSKKSKNTKEPSCMQEGCGCIRTEIIIALRCFSLACIGTFALCIIKILKEINCL